MSDWRPGQTFEIGGVDVRVVKGRKSPDDLRLEIRAMEFVPVKMSLGFLFADFYKRNEDVLYPPREGLRGGEMYLDFVRGAMQVGWEAAADLLDTQRAWKSPRPPVTRETDVVLEWL